ncbi:hypothetical protein KP509_15G035200 [Ceratopteris richardii]|uniref:Uncharacterized protein n=1 Tax=Ceratopteris richardii TaxID=49495 RepID=A0A8T2T5Z9_CERRI|nr:hypothetical protein KP509_15G035200 [Ceratopteris richardii]
MEQADIPEVSEVISMGMTSTRTPIKGALFHCVLARSCGKLEEKGVINKMSQDLKIIIAATTSSVAMLRQQMGDNIEWNQLVGTMTQNSLLEPYNAIIERSDKYIMSEPYKSSSKRSCTSRHNVSVNPVAQTVNESNGGYSNDDVERDKETNQCTKSVDEEVCESNGEQDEEVNSLKNWFLTLINHDEDILENSKLEVDGVLKKILDESQAQHEEFQRKQNFFKAGNDDWKVLDMGVLRYPDPDTEFFKLYRIQLTTWSTCKAKSIFGPRFSTGITGEFTCRTYKPRASVIQKLDDHFMQQAVREAEAMFAEGNKPEAASI